MEASRTRAERSAPLGIQTTGYLGINFSFADGIQKDKTLKMTLKFGCAVTKFYLKNTGKRPDDYTVCNLHYKVMPFRF